MTQSNQNFGGEGVSFEEGHEDGLTIDLNSVEDGDFEALPKGMYNVILEDLEFKFSESSGNPMWTWTLVVEDGDFAGRKLFMHTVWQGKGLPITKRAVSAVFPHLMQGPIDPKQIAESGSLLDTRMRARVDVRKYEGQNRNNVKQVFPAEQAGEF